jgi:mono/diheme cytochrome c family protein
MRRLSLIAFIFTAFISSEALAQNNPTNAARPDQFRDMLNTYCATCHSSRIRAGGVAFDAAMLDAVPDHAEVWESALRKLRGRLMPPPGNPQPDPQLIAAFAGWLETKLDAANRKVVGRIPIQRLTRTEYGIAVKDLLGVEIDAQGLLPTEIEVEGFENVAAALSVSPSFLEQYINAARLAAKLAVGETVPKVAIVRYPVAGNQGAYIDGFPLGTRGGVRFKHNFAADGEYRFNMLDLDVGLYPRTLATRHTLVILIDRQEVFRGQIGGPDDLSLVDRRGADGRAELMKRFSKLPVQVKAGVRDVIVSFVERSRAESDEYVQTTANGGVPTPRLLNGVEVEGPFSASGLSETPSRKRIFVCRPRAGEEEACARRIIENLARRAFRRPVTADDIAFLMPFYRTGSKESGGGFDAGIEQVVATILASPDFLYRGIRTPPQTTGAAADARAFRLTDLELASRLSFFLWSQGPDDELLKIAAAGQLSRPGAIEAQVRRMLADARAASLVRNFALKWLNVDNLKEVVPDPQLFPAFSDELRQDFAAEIEAFLTSILLEGRSVVELLTANHTFLNERLARHYGVPSVYGPQFRRVELQKPERSGLLGKGAVQLRTSYGDRTSPVLRGAWVLERLMGTPPAPPPPGVETDLSTPEGEKPKTLRARLEKHRNNATCNQCHGVIDPIGLALENFDAIGRWRDVDRLAQESIDANTVLPSGAKVNGPVELRQELFGRSNLFVRALTEKLMMYALGRELEYFDMPQVRSVISQAAKDDYRLTALVLGIVNSESFRMQGRKH